MVTGLLSFPIRGRKRYWLVKEFFGVPSEKRNAGRAFAHPALATA
jgi:hypothetical protein